MNEMNFRESIASCRFFVLSIMFLFFFLFEGCAGREVAPEDANNLCNIFSANRQWYLEADKASEKWGIPISVLMAIMYQESRYEEDALPPRTTCLFIFPGSRPSTAYGYSQAIDGTWEQYIQETDNRGAARDDFGDSIDFIGWYCYSSRRKCRISEHDAYNLYLAYHEGHTGFIKKTYITKKHLIKTALRVQHIAGVYKSQLAGCRDKLKDTGGCCLWPF